LAITMGIWDHIKNSGEHPTSANWAMDWVGMMPGKRGSRRLMGEVLMTQLDLQRGTWPDAVAMGGWAMDDHPPSGFDRPDLPPNTTLRTDEVYDIPLRALYSRNVANLLMAGRNISATHSAFTSSRVMATCACIGQAAGTAAALCSSRGLLPRQLAANPDLVRLVQQRLLRQDQSIRTVRNEDPADLARSAKVSASAHLEAAAPELVVDGIDRDIPANKTTGKPAEIHHWGARLEPAGTWLELRWKQPQRIRELVLKFDSGFQRQLTLSSSDSVTRTTIRGPQPEIISDYVVEGLVEQGSPLTLASVSGNHQRLNRLVLGEPTTVSGIRIRVLKTQGSEEARIFEVRCYA
jgi:hypothetical protein